MRIIIRKVFQNVNEKRYGIYRKIFIFQNFCVFCTLKIVISDYKEGTVQNMDFEGEKKIEWGRGREG